MSVGGDSHNVFVYGSLLADEVVHTLLKRVPPTAPAILHDYHRFKIKGRVYPAILPVQNNKVNGRVLLGISGAELDVLDEFEDVEYTRTDVEVSLKDMPEKLQVSAYVWNNLNDPNLYAEWDFERPLLAMITCDCILKTKRNYIPYCPEAPRYTQEWKQVHMNDFVKMTDDFMQELELPESKPRVQTYETFYKQENNKPLEP